MSIPKTPIKIKKITNFLLTLQPSLYPKAALLLTIVKALVMTPDEVSIEVANDDQFVNFNLKVASQDVGRVIGKNGTVVQSIRSLIYGIRIDDDRRIKLNVID